MAYEDPVYHDPDDELEGQADDVLKKMGIQPHHFGMGYSVGKMMADAPKYPDETLKDPTLVHAQVPTESSPTTGEIPELPAAPKAPAVPEPAAPKPATNEPGNLVNTAPTTPAPPEEKPSTGIGSPLRPPTPTMQRTMADTDAAQKEYDRLISTGSGIDQIKRPFLRGLARAGDIAGSAFFPGVMMGIPGTDLHHRELVDIQAGRVQRGLNQQKQEAETQKEQVSANEKEPSPEQQAFNDYLSKGMSASEAFRKTMLDKAGQRPEKIGPAQAAFDAYVKEGMDPREAFKKVQETLTEVKPDTEAQDNQRYETLMAKEYQNQKLTTAEKAWVKAYERRKQLGPLASGSQADKRQGERDVASATREARREILKAQNQYQNSKEAGDALNGFIKLAQSGNKEAAATVPLEGTLRIVTSQGVKRINRTEVEGITGAGSLFDMIQGKVQKLTKGQPIPPDLLNDFKQLNDLLIQGAYKNYSETFENTKGLYPEVDFTKFKKITGPGGEEQSGERSVKKVDLERIAHEHNMSYEDAKADAVKHGIKVIE